MTKKVIKKPKEIEREKTDELLTTSKLAEVSGIRYSTIKYYSQIGILPFEQAGKRLIRRYNKKEALKRLKDIQRFKDKRLTIKEIIDYFKKSTK